MGADRELRIRTVHSPDNTRTMLTYKGARVDEASGSKPEAETRVEDADSAHDTTVRLAGSFFGRASSRSRRTCASNSSVSPRCLVIPMRNAVTPSRSPAWPASPVLMVRSGRR
ncbi:hypothetical protein [Streptomyces sp. LS1784]|uniref:hypothetical protein n=1 Tax=Streptomyces sp. LS1784 TaxID=2851533 RepID=UPI0027DEEC2C|nr:hypothetical protein [Streptomyces sp. LS1784]